MSKSNPTQIQNLTQTPTHILGRGKIIKTRIDWLELEQTEDRIDDIVGAMAYDIKVLLAKHGKKELGDLIEEIVRNYIERIKLEYDLLITGSED